MTKEGKEYLATDRHGSTLMLKTKEERDLPLMKSGNSGKNIENKFIV
jgi:hypothetical protein